MQQSYLTFKETCNILGKSKRTITRYIKAGKLKPERIKNEKGILEYRFDQSKVKSFKSQIITDNSQKKINWCG